MVAQFAKAPLEPRQFARNGKYPDAFFQSELADAANRCAMFRMKQLAAFATWEFPGTFGDGERKRWRFRFVSSPYVSQIVFKASLGQTTPEGTGSRPRATLTVKDSGGTTVAVAEIQFGAAATGGTTPDKLGHVWTWVTNPAGTAFWTPTANTEYQAIISDHDNGIAVAACVYEIPINLSPPFNDGYAVGTPILDTDRETIAAGAANMWKYQGSPLFHWTVDTTPQIYSQTAQKNVIDNTSTTVATSTPGYTLDLRNKARLSTGTVPVKLWAHGLTSAGSGGTVILKDAGGNAVATISSITTEGWYSTTANLPATNAKYDVHYAGDGTNLLSLHAVSLLQYLA